MCVFTVVGCFYSCSVFLKLKCVFKVEVSFYSCSVFFKVEMCSVLKGQ